MPTHPPIPPPPEPQEPLDLGNLSKYCAGEYIKADGRWYFINSMSFVTEALGPYPGQSLLKQPHKIELELTWVPWKKDD